MQERKGYFIMKIQSQGTGLVLAKTSREGTNRQIYYNLAVLFNNEAGNLSCTPEAYEDVTLYKENVLFFEYNSEYKSFRVIGAMPVNPETDGGSGFGTDLESALNQNVKPEADKKQGAKPDKPGK